MGTLDVVNGKLCHVVQVGSYTYLINLVKGLSWA